MSFNFISKIESLFYLFLILTLAEFLFYPLSSLSYSRYPYRSKYHLINSNLIYSNKLDRLDLSGFIDQPPILKIYGPLTLDINNFHFYSGTFLVPALNEAYKPLFIAINCDLSLFNVKGEYKWGEWFEPYFNYERDILNDFCN